jgi:hypothetical protein
VCGGLFLLSSAKWNVKDTEFLSFLKVVKPKRKLTAAEKRERRERKEKFMTIFINGKKKRVPRLRLTEDDFIMRNADPILLHEMGLWHLIPVDTNG